jgi:hypothetical protein
MEIEPRSYTKSTFFLGSYNMVEKAEEFMLEAKVVSTRVNTIQ